MNKFKISTNYKKILSYLVVVLWMALIFVLSSQAVEQSNNLSKKVTELVVDAVDKVAPAIELSPKKTNHILRKNAHFFAYLILGVLTMNLLRTHKVDLVKSITFALIICILYAVSDEVHQLFVPGRGAQIGDVIIDTFGATVGIITFSFIFRD